MLKRLAVLLPFLLAPVALQAQLADVSVGGGINTLGTSSVHGSFVASASAHLGPYFTLGGEYAYQKVGGSLENAEDSFYNAIVQENEHLQNYGGVWRVGFPHRHATQSYLLLAGGGLHLTNTATFTIQPYSSASTTLSATQVKNGTYLAAGGGFSIPVHRGFGIRPEFRYERQMLSSYDVAGYDFPATHANQILFTIALYKGFGH